MGPASALEVADEATLLEGKWRLAERGIDVVGPTDHGFCKSIYFFDPSGHRMEMTARSEAPGDRDRFALAAPAVLAEWETRKQQGALRRGGFVVPDVFAFAGSPAMVGVT